MKKLLTVLLALSLTLGLALPAWAEEFGANARYIHIQVQDVGDIYAALYPDIAPITVENFMKLVDQKFYDGLTFHRIISGFMIQGGDPLGNGTGGSPDKIKGEFSANGVENTLLHDRGVLSMARSQDMNSASSQFFIMHRDSPHLDGSYAAFGRVLAGMGVVDKICMTTPVQDNNGTVLAEDQPVIAFIREVDRAEADEAAAAEKLQGQGGTVYRDFLSNLSFTVPEGWQMLSDEMGQANFYREEDSQRLMVVRSNQYDSLPAVYKQQLAAQGMTRDKLDTTAFRREALIGMVSDNPDAFTEETHSDILFYTGVEESNAGTFTYYVGAENGYVLLFAFMGDRDTGAFAQAGTILDELTFE